MKFPEYLKENHMIAPCDIVTVKKDAYVTDVSEMEIDMLPPRIISVNMGDKLITHHKKTMETFCHVLENKYAQP